MLNLLQCRVVVVLYIITVTIKIPSFDDVNTFSQIIKTWITNNINLNGYFYNPF